MAIDPIQIAAQLNINKVQLSPSAISGGFINALSDSATKGLAKNIADAANQLEVLARKNRSGVQSVEALNTAYALLAKSIGRNVKSDSFDALADRGEVIVKIFGKIRQTVNDFKLGNLNVDEALKAFDELNKKTQTGLEIPEDIRQAFEKEIAGALSSIVKTEVKNVEKEFTSLKSNALGALKNIGRDIQQQISIATARGGDSRLVANLTKQLDIVAKKTQEVGGFSLSGNLEKDIDNTKVLADLLEKIGKQRNAIASRTNRAQSAFENDKGSVADSTKIIAARRNAERADQAAEQRARAQARAQEKQDLADSARVIAARRKAEATDQAAERRARAQAAAKEKEDLADSARVIAANRKADATDRAAAAAAERQVRAQEKQDLADSARVIAANRKADATNRAAEAAAARRQKAENDAVLAINNKIAQAKKRAIAQEQNIQAAIETQQRRINVLLEKSAALRKSLGKAASPEEERLRAIANLNAEQLSQDGTVKKGIGGRLQGLITQDEIDKLIRAQIETNKLNKELTNVRGGFELFGRQIALAFRRYGAFLIGGGLILRNIISFFRSATSGALDFEKQVTRVQQVLNQTDKFAKNISKSIREASRATGTLAAEIGKGTLAFAQSGIRDQESLLEIITEISKVPLSATFDDISSTAEGLIAVFGQFNKTASNTREVLDLVNQFASDFAIESGDFFEAAKRGGAAFATAGGSFEEFVQLLSVLRESTRESANTLGTFFKTGFAQLLQDSSQAKLRQLGVTADDLTGQLTQLADILASDRFGNIERINIARELTGQRQFARLLALLREIRDPEVQRRLSESLSAAPGSFDKSIETRLDDIGTNLSRLRGGLLDFINALTEDENLKRFINNITQLSTSLTGLAQNLIFVTPLLAGLAAPLIGRGIKETGAVALSSLGLIGNKKNQSASKNIGSVGIPTTVIDGKTLVKGIVNSIPFGKIAAGAGVAGFIGGQILNNFGSDQIKPGGVSQKQLGQSINTGVISGLFAASVVNPIAAVAIGLTSGFLSLNEQVDENRKAFIRSTLTQIEIEKRNLAEEKKNIDTPDQIRARQAQQTALSGRSVQAAVFSPGVLQGVSLSQDSNKLGEIFSDQFSSIFRTIIQSSFGSLTNNEDKINQSIFSAFRGGRTFTGGPNDLSVLGLETIRESLKNEGDLGKQVREILSSELSNITSTFNIDLEPGTTDKEAQLLAKNKLLDFIEQSFGPVIRNRGDAGVLLSEALGENAFKNITGSVEKEFQDPIFKGINNFRQAIVDVLDNAGNFLLNRDRDLDTLNSINTSPLSLQSVTGATNNRDLLSQAGLDTFVTSVLDANQQISSDLQDFFRANREVVRGFLSGQDNFDENFSQSANLRDSLTAIFSSGSISKNEQDQIALVVDDIITRFGDSFNRLAAEGDIGFFELFQSLINETDFDKAVEGLRNTADVEASLAEIVRKDLEVFNRRLEIERELQTNILNTEVAISQLVSQLNALNVASSQAAFEQESFVNNFTEFQKLIGQANILLGQAGSSQFGDTTSFINDALSTAQKAFEDQSRLSGNPNLSIQEQKDLAQEAANSQQEFLRAQSFLAERLGDLQTRIQAAAQASQLFKQAIENQVNGLRSFGSSISQLTSQELAKSIVALKQFRQGGLESLNRGQFDSLTKLLSSVGDLNIGGITGNQLLGNINEQLGTEALAVVRSSLSGQSVDTERRNIGAELEALKKQQADAAALEQRLRDEQKQLVNLQLQIQREQLEYFKDQTQLLGEINASISNIDFNIIQRQIDKLFNVALPVTDQAPSGVQNRVEPRNFTPSPQVVERRSNRLTPTPIGPSELQNPIRGPIDPYTLPNRPGNRVRPDDLTPNIPIDTRDPFDPFNPEPKKRPDLIFVDQSAGGFGSGVDKQDITSLTRNIASIQSLLESIAGEGFKSTLEISPINVNVNVAAPDFIKMVGPQIKSTIMREISVKLSEIFEDSPEVSGRIASEFGTV